MSFWDLAHGRTSDIVPPKDSSTQTPQIAGVTGAAFATAGILLTALYRPQDLGKAAPLARLGFQSVRHGSNEAEKRLLDNEQKAIRRRELGCSYLEKLASRDPSSANLCGLARAQFATGKSREALQSARTVLETDANNAEARGLAIFYLLRLEDLKGAEDLAKEHIPIDLDPILFYAIIDHLFRARLSSLAKDFLDATIENNPSDVMAWERLGQFHELGNDIPEAVLAFERAHRLDSQVVLPWTYAIEQGDQAAKEGRLGDADRLYRKAALFKPRAPEVLMARALLAINMREFSTALTYLHELIENNDSNAQAYFMMGDAYQELKNFSRSHEYWDKSFRIDSAMPVPWRLQYERGRELLRQGSHQEALRELEAAHAKCEWWQEPEREAVRVRAILSSHLLEKEGDIAMREGRTEVALAHWQEACTLTESADLLMKLGALQADQGEGVTALICFERALTLGHRHAALATAVCRAYSNFVPEVGPQGVQA